MLMSVCIPTHDRREMLLAALGSVLDQDCADIEVVVSDNASVDGSADTVERLGDPRVKLLRQQRNIGSVANHNACVEAASGTWILFLHDDDLLQPGGLDRVGALLRECEGCDIVLPGYVQWILDGDALDNSLRLLNGISPSSTLYRREFLLRTPFETDNPCCDWEILFVAALHRSRFRFYSFAFVERRHHRGQEGAQVVRDGRGVIGKANAVRRLCAQMTEGDWDGLCRRISLTWTTRELMEFARYVRIADFRDRFQVLKGHSEQVRKWHWSSKHGVLIVGECVLGPAVMNRLLLPWRTWIQGRKSLGE
jgi:glycosyltransferase involved in cell wall biosynthesis